MSRPLRARPLALSGAAPLALVGAALAPAAADAAELQVKVEIPRLQVAEYHRPYVSLWIQKADESAAGTLAVWYDAKNKEDAGQKWLKDMRQWWRKAGRGMSFPADGISGATRAPGVQAISFSSKSPALAQLPPGDYRLVVEAAREVGGTEAVKASFKWPPAAAATTSAKGSAELGVVSVSARP